MSILTIAGRRIQTVVFDFDGTLAKLNIDFARMRREINHLIADHHLNIPDTKPFALEMIAAAEAALSLSDKQKAHYFRRKAMCIIEEIEMRAAAAGELFPSTKELFTDLATHGIACAIISRNCQKAVFAVFPDVLSYCPVVLCRDDVQKVKPDPQHLQAALNLTGRHAHNALMVGDHPLDIEVGRRVGTLTAGVLTGNFRETAFRQAGADIVLPQASCLKNLFHE